VKNRGERFTDEIKQMAQNVPTQPDKAGPRRRKCQVEPLITADTSLRNKTGKAIGPNILPLLGF